jgi:hypothetical protein
MTAGGSSIVPSIADRLQLWRFVLELNRRSWHQPTLQGV